MNKRTYEDFLQTISRSPTKEECGFLAAHMRKADREEALAAGALEQGRDMLRNLLEAVSSADTAVVVYAPGTKVPVAIYGATSFPEAPGVGFLWMQGTDALGAECKLDFLRLGRFGVDELAAKYQLLVCFADSRNTLHTRWLRWSGFTPINRTVLHDQSVPFIEFILQGKRRPNV